MEQACLCEHCVGGLVGVRRVDHRVHGALRGHRWAELAANEFVDLVTQVRREVP